MTASPVATLAAPSDMTPAADVARDLSKRGAVLLPAIMGIAALVADVPTALSIGYAMAIILVNLAAWPGWTVQCSRNCCIVPCARTCIINNT